MVSMEHGPHVLVGYDGSAGAEQAVHYAVTEARMRRLPLTICHVWQWLYPEEFKKTSTLEGVRSIGGHILERGVTIARAQAPDLTVYSRLVNGSVVAALLHEASQADLIVLGAHGSGGFADLDVGSGALQVPAYASCPVVVVR